MPIGVTGPDSPVSITTSMALAMMPCHARPCGIRVPGHAVLEPLGVVRQLLESAGLLLVDVEDHRLPRALDAPRIHVDLDEPVDGVHRRVLVRPPRRCRRPRSASSPVRYHCTSLASASCHRLGGERLRRLEVADDGAYLRVVAATHLVDLFDQLAVLLDQPRVQSIPLDEALQVGHRHARRRGCWRSPAGCPCPGPGSCCVTIG